MSQSLRVLILEDRLHDAEMLIRELRRAGYDPDWRREDNEAGFLSALKQSPELILSDYSLPQYDGLQAMKAVRESDQDIPFILVSGTVGEEIAVQAMQAGVTDYLLKDRLSRLGPAVQRALEARKLREEHRSANLKFRASERRYRRLFESAKDGILILNSKSGMVDDVNPFLMELLGFSREEFLSKKIWELGFLKNLVANEAKFIELQQSEYVRYDGLPLKSADGRQVDVEFVSNVYDVDGESVIQCNIRDITDRKRAEESLRQSEARLRVVTERARVGLVVVDADHCFTFSNAAFSMMFGLSDGSIVGKSIADVLPDAYGERILPELVRAFDGERISYELHLPIQKPQFHYALNYEPVINGERVTHVVIVVIDITEQQQTWNLLRLQERVIHATTQGIVITDALQPDCPILFTNRGFELITGYSASEALGRNCRFLQGQETDAVTAASIREAIREERAGSFELLNYRKNGTTFWNDMSITPVRDDNGQLTHFVGVQNDVTARREAEQQVRQSQKMEAVGQLAGGVAHDFNNLLTVIDGYTSLMLETNSSTNPEWEYLQEIRTATSRAADLTRRLLAFGRRQLRTPESLDLNTAIEETVKLLERLLCENVVLEIDLDAQAGWVWADRGEISQILLNLAINARDAMPDGGQISVTTKLTELDHSEIPTGELFKPGKFAVITVSDTGSGIPKDVQAKMFEPFFTTKPAGKGTGLGLSTVYGIVIQTGGHIEVSSTEGEGTSFRIYLPQLEHVEETEPTFPVPTVTVHGTETLLLVEDDSALRRLTKLMLTSQGYQVLEAANGQLAVDNFAGKLDSVHLLVTDLMMPGISGLELAEQLIKVKPGLRVLFLSGYIADPEIRDRLLHIEGNFLLKPFSATDLVLKVREALQKV